MTENLQDDSGWGDDGEVKGRENYHGDDLPERLSDPVEQSTCRVGVRQGGQRGREMKESG